MLRKLLRLTPAAWADLCVAQLALIHARILLLTRRRGELLGPSSSVSPAAQTAESVVAPQVGQLALAVERAAEHGLFRPTCLVQAIALQRMLTSRGYAGSSVRVGVHLQQGRFLAHAWVDYRGAVLADRTWRVNRFDQLANLDVLQT